MSPYIIPGIVRFKPVTLDQIVDAVIGYTGIPLSEMQKKRRFRQIVFSRQLIIYLARKKTKMTLVSIGNFFNQDHSTSMYSITQIKGLLKIKDPETVNAIREIEKILR